jgi:DNA polymerase-3 subunit alpha
MGLQVLAPEVNESFAEFAVVPDSNQIRFGLNAVKNVGGNAVEEILRAREEGGEFETIEDFAKRVNVRIVNRKNLESLVKAGAFDRFGDRATLLFSLDAILAFANKLQKEAESGQVNLFGESAMPVVSLQLEQAPAPVQEQEKLLWERELLGLYLSSHPLDAYDLYLTEQSHALDQLKAELDGALVSVGGVISAVRQIATKNGDKMAFVKLESKAGEIELIIFPKMFEKCQATLVQDRVVVASGRLNAKDRNGNITDELKVLADDVKEITAEMLETYQPTGETLPPPAPGKAKGRKAAAVEAKPKEKIIYQPVEDRPPEPAPPQNPKLYVHVKDPANHDALLKLKQTFNQYPGESEVILVLGHEKKSAIRLPFTVNSTDELHQQLISLYGQDCVALK